MFPMIALLSTWINVKSTPACFLKAGDLHASKLALKAETATSLSPNLQRRSETCVIVFEVEIVIIVFPFDGPMLGSMDWSTEAVLNSKRMELVVPSQQLLLTASAIVSGLP